MRQRRTRWIVLVVVGSLVTAASALVGLRALAELAWRVDELDDWLPVPVPRLFPGEKGPLLGLAQGQSAEVHYRSLGCFRKIDEVLTFGRAEDGGMYVEVHALQPEDRGDLHRRVLTEVEVLALDRQLLFAQRLRGGRCTIREEYDVIVLEAGRRLSQARFANEACLGPDLPPGALSLAALATPSSRRPQGAEAR